MNKEQRKRNRLLRRKRQNKRSENVGEYGTGRTRDRKRQQGDWTRPFMEMSADCAVTNGGIDNTGSPIRKKEGSD